MPELPEVETVRSSLDPVLRGRTFTHVEVRDERLTRPFAPQAVASELEGERVAAVERRGKYLIVRFESGRALLVHLRMTGSFLHGRGTAQGAAGDPHARAVITLDDGSDVIYRDVRRFGTWLLVEEHELEPYLDARLGAEPFTRGFGPAALAARLANRRAPVKAALLDQRTVAGMGNIYADEALWRARVHPLRPAREPPRLPATRRPPRRDAVRVPRLRPRRRAVRALRHPNREDTRRGPRHVVLPELPAPVIRRATADDVEAIRALVESAYEHYIPRIGMRPVPMDDDYGARVARGEAFVTGDDTVEGVVVLVEHDDHLLIDNVAVHPARQGRGIGRALLAFAEERASQLGLDELRLYTHAKMVENRAFYARLGYEETSEDEFVGRPRVHMRKKL